MRLQVEVDYRDPVLRLHEIQELVRVLKRQIEKWPPFVAELDHHAERDRGLRSRKVRDRLRYAVVIELEILSPQTADRITILVLDKNVQIHQIARCRDAVDLVRIDLFRLVLRLDCRRRLRLLGRNHGFVNFWLRSWRLLLLLLILRLRRSLQHWNRIAE